MPPRRPERDYDSDLAELFDKTSDHGARLTPLELWHDAVKEARKTWGNRAWVFVTAVTGSVVTFLIIQQLTRGGSK